MRFGVFTPSIVRPDRDPTWSLERQLVLAQHFDAIGNDEAWFGEHHNGVAATREWQQSRCEP